MTTWYTFGLVPGFFWLDFDLSEPIDFGNRVQLTGIPAWLRGATYVPDCTANCVWRILDRQADVPQFAIVHRFDAPGLDNPDPEWKGPETMSYRRASVDRLMLTTAAVWLIRVEAI